MYFGQIDTKYCTLVIWVMAHRVTVSTCGQLYIVVSHLCITYFNAVTELYPYMVMFTCELHARRPHLLNYITWLLWRPHKLLLSNYSLYRRSCKWQPPWWPFASALVTDWYQYSGCCATHARGATL